MSPEPGRPLPGVLTRSQRVAAAALPTAALALGVLAPRCRVAAALALAGPVAAVCSSLALTRAAARARHRADRAGEASPRIPPPEQLPFLSVVIPACDEAAVIGGLIADLGAQDHRSAGGRAHFDVIVIDDRSTDGTGDVARTALHAAGLDDVSRILRRDRGAAPGKSAALADVSCFGPRADAMLVLDADARVDPGFLRRAAQVLSTGQVAVTARRRMLAPIGGRAAHLLAAVQDDEQTVDGAIQAGRWALGAGSEFRGDGSLIGLEALRIAGGWDPGALCEDLELSGRLLATQSKSVAWDPALVVWEQPVVEVRALLRQRLRWAEGLVRRELRVTPAVLGSSCLPVRQRAIVLAYSMQSLAPVVALGLVVRLRSRRARRLLLVTAAAYAASGMTLGAGALRGDALAAAPPSRDPSLDARGLFDARSGASRLARALAVVGFSAAWVALLPMAWMRAAFRAGPPHFARTTHSRRFSDPPSPATQATAG